MSGDTTPADPLNDHTLLITTFNRPAFLHRLLVHLVNALPVGQVHIVDGSVEPCRSQNTRIVAAFEAQVPLVLHQLEPGIPCIDHIIAAAELVETAFVTWCHDDNFVLAETLRASVAFLRAHGDYVNCSGQIVTLSEHEHDTVALVCNTCRVDQDEPFERFSQFLANHWNADFGTWRSRVFRQCAVAQYLVPRDQTIGEPLPVALGTLHGKIHVLPAPGTLFVEHAVRRSTAVAKRYGPSQPDFCDVVSAAVQLVADQCDALQIDRPDDLRSVFVAGYMRSFLKWTDNTNSGPRARPAGANEAIPVPLWHGIVDKAESAIWSDLARQDPDTGGQMRLDRAHRYPDPKEVFRLHGSGVVFAEIGTSGDNGGDPLERSPAKPLPTHLDGLIKALSDPGWTTTYQEFRCAHRERILGELAESADRDALFDDAFQQALTDIARPLLDYRHDELEGHTRASGLGDFESRALLATLDAVRLMHCYPQAHPDSAGGTIERASDDFRMLPAVPDNDADLWPFETSGGEVQERGAITFVPLRLDPALASTIGQGHACWLRVDVAAVSGRIQLGLYREGTVEALKSVDGAGCPKTIYLQVAQPDYAFLIIRDLAIGNVRSRCSVSGLRWLSSTRPLVHAHGLSDPKFLAA